MTLLSHNYSPKMYMYGKVCIVSDVDECATNTFDCPHHSSCTNAPTGSYSCVCNIGYEYDPVTGHCLGEFMCTLVINSKHAVCTHAWLQQGDSESFRDVK